jgi:HTH-type transcriptional regulator, transcriptional repressor of NAD biosynthesis genes
VKAHHSLIIGRFNPPHEGHHFLIDTAARSSKTVTVVVTGTETDAAPIATRVAWLRAAHTWFPHVTVVGAYDPHQVDYQDPAVWDLHERVVRDAVSQTGNPAPVDAIFTPAATGPEWARRFHATLVDLGHSREPFLYSSTDIRRDPVAHWDDIRPVVRGWLTKRVVVLGAESTGTTTLVKRLREEYRRDGGPYGLTQWVHEFGRDMSWIKLNKLRAERAMVGGPEPTMDDVEWSDKDFIDIVREQNRLEDEAARLGGPLLLCDTDSFASLVWQERYLGRRTADVAAFSQHEPRTLYILTSDEGVDFVQDGVRDGEHLRQQMTQRFRECLAEQSTPWIELSGTDHEARVRAAKAAIDDALQHHPWRIGPA